MKTISILQIHYPELGKCQPYLGNEVDVCGLGEIPAFRWPCRSNKLYTIIFLDINPIGEKHPTYLAQGILWWRVDVPGCDIHSGKTIYGYQQPTPNFGAGKSKYAFFVYEQQPDPTDWSTDPPVSST